MTPSQQCFPATFELASAWPGAWPPIVRAQLQRDAQRSERRERFRDTPRRRKTLSLDVLLLRWHLRPIIVPSQSLACSDGSLSVLAPTARPLPTLTRALSSWTSQVDHCSAAISLWPANWVRKDQKTFRSRCIGHEVPEVPRYYFHIRRG